MAPHSFPWKFFFLARNKGVQFFGEFIEDGSRVSWEPAIAIKLENSSRVGIFATPQIRGRFSRQREKKHQINFRAFLGLFLLTFFTLLSTNILHKTV